MCVTLTINLTLVTLFLVSSSLHHSIVLFCLSQVPLDALNDEYQTGAVAPEPLGSSEILRRTKKPVLPDSDTEPDAEAAPACSETTDES